MKIHETLTSLLIIGSLRSTTAQIQLPIKDYPGFEAFDTSTVNIEAIQKQFEDKCEKNGGPTAFETVKKTPEYFTDCMSSIVDVNILAQDVQAAVQHGKLDTVFRKYCNKVPKFEKCVRNVTDIVALCLDPEEKKGVEFSYNITISLLDFACLNEGDPIAMFIAVGGVECIKDKQPEILVCARQTVGRNSTASQNTLPSMVIDPEYCKDLEKFEDCVVAVLESCPDPTPANLVNSMLNYVNEVTPCEKLLNNPPPPTSKGMNDPEQTVEELYKKSLVKQIEAAEAQVRAANAQVQAAHAQEQAARVVEQLGRTWPTKSRYPTHRYPASW